MRFVVTGGVGFIGSEVVRQLLEKGEDVTIIDDLSKKHHVIPKDCKLIKLDLTGNKAEVAGAFKGADICINLAAKIGGIGYFHKYPAYILNENNKIYSNTFEAAVDAGIKRMVYISSSMVFENTKRFPSKEADLFRIPAPVTAYGFSKLVGEWYCRSFAEQYGLKYTIIRPFNAYGINEYPEKEVGYAHVIPDLVRKILKGQYPLELLGDGKQTRCFTHVSDVARGITMAAESPRAVNEDFNIGSEKEIRMVDLAKILWRECGMTKPFKAKFVKGFKYDIRRRVPDSSKARRVLGWRQRVRFEDGLHEVIQWLRQQRLD